MYTPRNKITCCEITSNGNYVILGMEEQNYLTTLQLRGPNIDINLKDEVYGEVENTGKSFEMQEDNC